MFYRLRKLIFNANKCIKSCRSLILYWCSGNNRRNHELLKRFKDKHCSQRIFIVCNGPSLNAADLTTIHQNGDLSFASNKIDKIFPYTDWRPTYYTVMDEVYQHSLFDTMNSIPAECMFYRRESFFTTRNLKRQCIYLNTYSGSDLLKETKFSDDCSKIVYSMSTVTYVMIQLAVYMGIKEIYIIGCDNHYGLELTKEGKLINNGTQSYFTGSDQNDQQVWAATWQMNIAYEYAQKYADNHGIKIYNATRGGYLEAFERVDFDSLF